MQGSQLSSCHLYQSCSTSFLFPVHSVQSSKMSEPWHVHPPRLEADNIQARRQQLKKIHLVLNNSSIIVTVHQVTPKWKCNPKTLYNVIWYPWAIAQA
jgi:hypothetical protein